MVKEESYIKKFFLQLTKFGLTGIITTLYGIVAYYFLLEKLDLPLYPVYVVVYLIGVLISYLLNTKLTFEKEYNAKDSFKYLLSYLAGLTIGLGFLYFFDKAFPGFSNFHLTLLVIPARFLITFLIIKKFIFK